MQDRRSRQVAGYLAQLGHQDDPDREITALNWTVRIYETLAPDTFLAAPLSPSALLRLAESATDGPRWWDGIMVVLEPGRVGRRQAEHERAVATLRSLGLRVALSGHRVAGACGYDALLVDRRSAASWLEPDDATLIVTGITDEDDLTWAEERGADIVEGPFIGEPIRIAPVDLARLTR